MFAIAQRNVKNWISKHLQVRIALEQLHLCFSSPPPSFFGANLPLLEVFVESSVRRMEPTLSTTNMEDHKSNSQLRYYDEYSNGIRQTAANK